MIAILLNLLLASLRNRIFSRVRRLKQARYLIATLAGIAYFSVVWRPWRAVGHVALMQPDSSSVPGSFSLHGEIGFGVMLTVFAIVSWVWPRGRPSLEFTEPEIAFLFPAPLSRRQVIDYALLKSQIGILFGVLVLTIFGLRHVATSFWFALPACWAAFSALHLHSLAASIVRASIFKYGATGLRRSWLPVAVAVVVIALIAWWAVGWLRPPPSHAGREEVTAWVFEMLTVGPVGWLLMPGRLIARPAFARSVPEFLISLFAPLLLLALSYAWVVRAEFEYEEASAERAARRAQMRERRRWRAPSYTRVKISARRPPFDLSLTGPPETAIVWKNLIAAGRFLRARSMILALLTVPLAAGIVSALIRSTRWAPALPIFGAMFGIVAFVLVLTGPDLVRSDLRLDLRRADILKGWPVSGRQLVVGEVLAPAIVVTWLQSLLVMAAVPFLGGTGDWSTLEWGLLATGVMVLAGPLNVITGLVQNAALLTFPSWHVIGPGHARGVEAFGQNLIAGLLRLVVLVVVLVPVLVVLAIGFFLVYPIVGMAAAPAIALAAVVPAIIEAWLGLKALGYYFDAFDPSKELDIAV